MASDGRWYAPELHPNYSPPPPPPPSPPASEVPTAAVPPVPTTSMPVVPSAQSGGPIAAHIPGPSGPQTEGAPLPDSKPPIYKKWWIWAIAAVVLLAIGGSAAAGSKKNTNASATSTTSAPPRTGAPASTTTTYHASATTTHPAPTTAPPAPATTSPAPTTTIPAGRHVQGTAVTLGAGTFTGGKDVAGGLYDITPGAGQSGNFIVSGSDSYDEILGFDGTEGVPTVRVTISNGDQIQISSLSAVTFTPVTTPLTTSHTTTNLYAGTWTVGQDIGAGRYVATPGSGQSGNFIVSGNDSYDEILGGDSSLGGVPSVTVSLSNGDVIDISGMSQVTMTAQ